MRYRGDGRGHWAGRGTWLGGLVAAVALAGCLAACDVQFNAPKLVLHVHDDGLVFAGAGDAQRLTGGETVLTIQNRSIRERQIVLARLGDLETIPDELLAAETAKEDSRILGMTHVLAPATTDEPVPEPDSTRFHVYLAPGERHVLFDRLGGFDDGLVLTFVPGGKTTAAPTTSVQVAAWQ